MGFWVAGATEVAATEGFGFRVQGLGFRVVEDAATKARSPSSV